MRESNSDSRCLIALGILTVLQPGALTLEETMIAVASSSRLRVPDPTSLAFCSVAPASRLQYASARPGLGRPRGGCLRNFAAVPGNRETI